MSGYTISRNDQFNSIEISFSAKPSETVRDALKALKFSWHSVKRVWYGYTTEEAVKAVLDGEKPTKKPAAAKPAEKANKYGVKVGDIFMATWGYDQTNNDFFQVVALVGEISVRVREVKPVCEASTSICWAAEDRTICTNTNGAFLPPAPHSVFIKDQERGDLKRLKTFAKDGSDLHFELATFANAYLCKGDAVTVYESWYA